MGRTSRWFRAFWGAKKSPDSSTTLEHSRPDTKEEKKKWGFVRSLNGNGRSNCGTRGNWYAGASSSGPYVDSIDANKHAIAVAAATAAVAEAALAAAHAAAEVVRLTSCGGSRPHPTCYYGGSDRRRELAAVKIQSAFRAYLARRALRALKGLVRLQALVRGHIVRKQSADMLRRMQALARIQARACANRAQMPSHSTSKSSQSHKPGLATIENDTQLRSHIAKSDRASILKKCQSKTKLKDTVDLERTCLGSNWLDQWMEECSWNSQGDTPQKAGRAEDERSDKILEVDTWKPHLNSKPGDGNFGTPQHVTPRNYNDLGVILFNPLSDHSPKPPKKNQSISYNDPLSLNSLKFPVEMDQIVGWAGDNSPQVLYSSSSKPGSSGRRGPFTPAISDCSRSFFSDYVGYPNYMANTESSLARVRSQSAPRQRMQQYEKLGSTKRFGGGLWDTEAISERGSVVHSNLSTKAHLGSCRLDGHGMPVQGNSTASYNSRYSARG